MLLLNDCNQNKSISKNSAKLSESSKCLQGISSYESRQNDRHAIFLLLFIANLSKIKSQEISRYKYIYIHVIHNNCKTHKVKCYKLVVRGNMFRPHCGNLQANLYKSSAFNVRTMGPKHVATNH